MSLVDGAFQFHNASVPDAPVTNAIPGGQRRAVYVDSSDEETGVEGANINPEDAPTVRATSSMPSNIRSLAQSSKPVVAELMTLCPNFEVAALLVATYFDKVYPHFHQDEFRKRCKKLYQHDGDESAAGRHNIGFISMFFMVIAIGLQYAGPHRRNILADYNVDHADLKERIFYGTRTKLSDIASSGSLEAVQSCVLLGTYYLFHGNPGQAWPVCGCGLRIAQALSLHRSLPRDGPSSSSITFRNQNETRKCCRIKTVDCDVEPLDPSAESQLVQSPTSFNEPLQCSTTLLSYKYFMSKLSILTKAALAELYRIDIMPADSSESSTISTSSLRHLIEKVAEFGSKLRQWQADLSLELQFPSGARSQISYSSPDELDQDVGASGPRFEKHIFQLQALALKLAYENARILVHRPLLSYRLVN